MLRVQASSRVLAVLGRPVTHSVSPQMQNAAIAALGLDAIYVALSVHPDDLPPVLVACRAAGIAGNLTVPLKEIAARHVRATPLAEAIGAVNTFWAEEGELRGDNTDVAGVDEALDGLGAEAPWLVCGTGGAARAVAAAAALRCAPLLVRSRDPVRARAFAGWAATLAHKLDTQPAPVELDDGRPVGTVINATPLGLQNGDAPPAPEDRWRSASAALDLVYRPGETAWVRACRARGLRAADGREMLLAQGARAFERFFPGRAAPREIMRAAVRRALGE